MSTDTTIACPSCKTEIKLTESLAAPLVESTRLAYEQRLADKDTEVREQKAALKQQAADLAKAREALDEEVDEAVAAKLKTERVRIAAVEADKARKALDEAFEEKAKALEELQAVLKDRTEKLAMAQEAEVHFRKKERDLDDQKRELELTIEKRLAAEQATIREKAKKDADEEAKLAILERDTKLAQLQKQIEELKRKSEQGSQQLQGEVLELDLENLLSNRFPIDRFEPVPKGEHGGDVLHRVNGPLGQPCGTILWESKRTKNWSDGWLAKLRDDQRTARAEIAVIVSQALPKDCETFALVDGVWVTAARCAFPVAVSLRQTLIEAATARLSSEGQQSKMELVYQYLTSPQFRQRVQAMVEVFNDMSEDLEKERRVILKQWDKRRMQIDRVVQATVGMYGDLQGIAGASLQEIEGMEVMALESV